MIKYYKGNLFLDYPNPIVHGCNSKGVMGSGFAKELVTKYPEIYDGYKNFCASPNVLGKIYVSETKRGTYIFNCITQENYGKDGKKYVSYDAVDSCFFTIKHLMEPLNFNKIHMPKIGAGLGGGNWDIISAIIESHMKDYMVCVYEL